MPLFAASAVATHNAFLLPLVRAVADALHAQRIAEAVMNILGWTEEITHEQLEISTDLPPVCAHSRARGGCAHAPRDLRRAQDGRCESLCSMSYLRCDLTTPRCADQPSRVPTLDGALCHSVDFDPRGDHRGERRRECRVASTLEPSSRVSVQCERRFAVH